MALKPNEAKPGAKVFWTPCRGNYGHRCCYLAVLVRMGEKRARIALALKCDDGTWKRVERSVDPHWLSPRDRDSKHDALLTPTHSLMKYVIRRELPGLPPRYYTDAGGWSTSKEKARVFPTRLEAIAYAQSRGWARDHEIIERTMETP